MIASFSLILLCQLIGEVFVRTLGLPVPVPVVGLILMFVILVVRDRHAAIAIGPLKNGAVEETAKGLLANLSLLFVPAGVGVVKQLDLVSRHGRVIFTVLAASVLVTLLVTAGTFLIVSRLQRRRGVS